MTIRMTRTLVRVVLEPAGATSTPPRRCAALAALAAVRPDVLLVDLGMPEMDGFEFIGQVRASADPAVRDVPAAALTAYARSEDRTKALRSGFEIHLAKPIDPARTGRRGGDARPPDPTLELSPAGLGAECPTPEAESASQSVPVREHRMAQSQVFQVVSGRRCAACTSPAGIGPLATRAALIGYLDAFSRTRALRRGRARPHRPGGDAAGVLHARATRVWPPSSVASAAGSASAARHP